MKDMFTLIGLVCLGCIVVFSIGVIFTGIKELVTNLIHVYKYKHRFDKPPIAKCYCRDCIQWNPSTGECGDHCNSRRMGPGWFCCFAEPASQKVMAQREKEMKNKEE